MTEAQQKTSWVEEEVDAKTAAAMLEEHAGHKVEVNLFEGRVTLWKLQTGIHLDDLDFLCAIYCAGQFVDGEGIFTDLKLKLT